MPTRARTSYSNERNNGRKSITLIGIYALLVLSVACLPSVLPAQERAPSFVVDPSWPKPLPNNWTTGQIGGVCVDSKDDVYIVNRRNLTDKELRSAAQAPPIIEFDSAGTVINSFGDPNIVPASIHGCTVDSHGNV